MNSKRVFFIMIGVLAILLLGTIGSAYVANMMLEKQATTLKSLKLLADVNNQEKTSLAQAKKDIVKYDELQQIAKTIVPQDKDQAETVRDIVKLAGDSGFKPTSITLPASTLGTGTKAVAGTNGVAAPTVGTNLTQLTPAKGNPGLYILEVTISQDSSAPIPYSQFIDFLSRLEQNRRTALVTSVVLQPSIKDPSMLSFTLTLNKYIKP
jgi:hypothetical protein